MEKTIMDLALRKELDLESLITHVVPFEQADRAYAMLDEVGKIACRWYLSFRVIQGILQEGLMAFGRI